MSTSPLAAFHRANALTYASLLSAIGAIASAYAGSAAAAGALIGLAVLADTFDGWFARLFRRTPEERAFGAELDSLSDAIAFGAAPCICMALIAPRLDGWQAMAWWIAFAAFASCAITRLAFYNVTHERATGFVGLPAPVAALVWATALLIDPGATVSILVLFATAVAMVMPVPVPRPAGPGLAVFAAWPVVVIVAHIAGM
jgi:CDP-diacylglycerol--serine O-phosphatidyltransferase